MLRAVLSLMAVLAFCSGAFAQNVISAKAGMIHYIEGKVLLDGREVAVNSRQGSFPSVKEQSVLRTELGRAEVLLAPGMFLRLGEDTSVRMIDSALTSIRLELIAGTVLLEISELPKDSAVRLLYKETTISPTRSGLYRLESDPAEFRVWAGKAEIVSNDRKAQAKKGQVYRLDGELVASKFDTDDTDPLYRWANRRAGYLAMANIPGARSLRDSNTQWLMSGWYWNPYFGTFTFIPRSGSIYSPFGFYFYSPRVIYSVYRPRVYAPNSAWDSGASHRGPVYNPNLGYSTATSRSYGGYTGSTASGAPAAAASAPAPSPRSAESAAPRSSGGGRGQ